MSTHHNGQSSRPGEPWFAGGYSLEDFAIASKHKRHHCVVFYVSQVSISGSLLLYYRQYPKEYFVLSRSMNYLKKIYVMSKKCAYILLQGSLSHHINRELHLRDVVGRPVLGCGSRGYCFKWRATFLDIVKIGLSHRGYTNSAALVSHNQTACFELSEGLSYGRAAYTEGIADFLLDEVRTRFKVQINYLLLYRRDELEAKHIWQFRSRN